MSDINFNLNTNFGYTMKIVPKQIYVVEEECELLYDKESERYYIVNNEKKEYYGFFDKINRQMFTLIDNTYTLMENLEKTDPVPFINSFTFQYEADFIMYINMKENIVLKNLIVEMEL